MRALLKYHSVENEVTDFRLSAPHPNHILLRNSGKRMTTFALYCPKEQSITLLVKYRPLQSRCANLTKSVKRKQPTQSYLARRKVASS